MRTPLLLLVLTACAGQLPEDRLTRITREASEMRTISDEDWAWLSEQTNNVGLSKGDPITVLRMTQALRDKPKR